MKSLLLLLAGAVVLGAPETARALPVDTEFDVVLDNGFDPNDAAHVATITFRLDASLGSQGCRYLAGWSNTHEGDPGTPCALDEWKTIGHASCFGNAQTGFATMVIKSPKMDCSVLDRTGQHQDVFLLVGAESAEPAGILGLIQWTAALPLVSVFEMIASP